MQTSKIAIIVLFTFILIVLDFCTGFLKASINKQVKSSTMRQGLAHKGTFIISIVLAGIMDYLQSLIDIGFTIPVLIATIAYIILTECVSIMENLCEINPKLSNSPVAQFLIKTKGKGTENDDTL